MRNPIRSAGDSEAVLRADLQRRLRALEMGNNSPVFVGEGFEVESLVTLTGSAANLVTVELDVPDRVSTVSILAVGQVNWGFINGGEGAGGLNWGAALSHLRINGVDSPSAQDQRPFVGELSTDNGHINGTLTTMFSRTITNPGFVSVTLRGLANSTDGDILSGPAALSVLVLATS